MSGTIKEDRTLATTVQKAYIEVADSGEFINVDVYPPAVAPMVKHKPESLLSEPLEVRTVSAIRVRYADTDAQGVVYHGAFFTFFEVARFDLLLRLLGSEPDVTLLWKDLAIASAHCDYEGPVCYPDVLTVKASVSKVGNTSFEIVYEVSKRDGMLVANGATVQVYLGGDQRPVLLPPGLRSRLECVCSRSDAYNRGVSLESR